MIWFLGLQRFFRKYLFQLQRGGGVRRRGFLARAWPESAERLEA